MTEFDFVAIVLVHVSVASLLAVNKALSTRAADSRDFRLAVQRHVFFYQFRSFLLLSGLLVAVCAMDVLNSGPLELFCSGILFGLFLAIPNLALCSAVAFVVSYALKWTVSSNSTTARLQGALLSPAIFLTLLWVFDQLML